MIRLHGFWLGVLLGLMGCGGVVVGFYVDAIYFCGPPLALHAICRADGICYFATDKGQPVNVTVHDDGTTSLRMAPADIDP